MQIYENYVESSILVLGPIGTLGGNYKWVLQNRKLWACMRHIK